ncbi:MAG: VCBS repeat-containing protein [Deltaproteobacteria bacterium]|nr:VCBS repeat-containing protein [Deltaproteobacteria bacterium]MBW2041040.1 VCBS repeat-containing protein [Deltaproteobacteria bacterium]
MNRKIHRILFFLFPILCFPGNAPAASPLRVAILPFQVNAPPELSYLKHGIPDMLASRLTWEDNVAVLRVQDPKIGEETGPVTEKTAREIGASLQADRVLFGSLTALGKSISIDIKLIDLSGEKPVRTFFTQSPSLDEVIPRIDQLAADINETAFGRSIPKKTPPAPEETRQPVDETRLHPEKLIEGGFQDSEDEGRTDIFLPAPGTLRSRASFWKSPNFDFLINGICAGDVNGDGKIETVVATPTEVRLFLKEGKRFREIFKIDLGHFINIVGVDAADINGNGMAEIFVSATNLQKNAAKSVVLEFNGTQWVPILKDSSWFYRVVGKQTGNPELLGQRMKIGEPFSGDIHEMRWQGDGYVEEKTILTDGVNLLGFAMGDVQNNGERMYVAYDPRDHIHIFGSSGSAVWKGSDRLGGSTLYFNSAKDEPGAENIHYLPMRIWAHDINKDGKTEVIAAKNHELIGSLLERFRVYTKSQFQVLAWDGIGLSLLRETRTLSGFVRDFFIADFDGDGSEELVAAVVMKEGSIAFTTPKCAIIAYALGEIQDR